MKKIYRAALLLFAASIAGIYARDYADMPTRRSEYPVNKIFINRWSPRAMSGALVTDEELMTLFEAAKWAPSSYNAQPWRFIYGKKGTAYWDALFDLLVPFNQSWAKNAGALVLIVSRKSYEHNGQPSRTHSFDTGAAWGYFALQGSINGLVVHGMSGFDYPKAKATLNIPDDYQIEAMVAVGKSVIRRSLPTDLQAGELPSGRKKIEQFASEGSFAQ